MPLGTRAVPLALDERQAMLIDAVIPLLLAHGRSVTSRQIAEAAGVAEGTIFRAFGDKETLVQAAIEKYLDPEPLREALRAIDAGRPLEAKIHAIVDLLQQRFASVIRMFTAVGMERPAESPPRPEFATIVADILAPDLGRLNWPPDRVAYIIRLISFASCFPGLSDSDSFSTDELSRIILTGIAGQPADAPSLL